MSLQDKLQRFLGGAVKGAYNEVIKPYGQLLSSAALGLGAEGAYRLGNVEALPDNFQRGLNQASQNLSQEALRLRQEQGTTGSLNQGLGPTLRTVGSGASATGRAMLGAYGLGAAPATLAATAGIGGVLGGGIAALEGNDPFEAAGYGVGSAPLYAGLNRVTAPAINNLMGRVNISNPVGQLLGRASVAGGANVLEDELFTRAIQQRAPTQGERLFSFGVGALASPLGARAPETTPVPKKRVPASEQPRTQQGRYDFNLKKEPIFPSDLKGDEGRGIRLIDTGNGRTLKVDRRYGSGFQKAPTVQSASGLLAGVEPEYDEEGNLTVGYDPARGALGVGLMAGVKSVRNADGSLKIPEVNRQSFLSDEYKKLFGPKPVSIEPNEKTLQKIAAREQKAAKVSAENDYKQWSKAAFSQEGPSRTPNMNLKRQVEDIGKTIQKQTTSAGTDVEKMKDISGFQAYTKDIYRNFKSVYGDSFGKVKSVLLDPFDKSKGELTDSYKNWSSRINKEIEVDLGIKKGSKESAAVQLYGEKKTSYEQLVAQFGKTKADNIVKADNWFRKEYDQLLDEVNDTLEKIYPNNSDRQIPKRQDYYRHFRDFTEGFSGLLNMFDSPANIASSLSGISEYTTPRSKWLSFAQKRFGKDTDVDAVGGFIDYVKAAEYNKKIDPHIGKFRALAEEIALKTEDNPKLNNFTEYLHDFANDLAGKTNPADRFIQKVIPGGRKSMRAINWLNSRVKANVILGNFSSSIAQIFNVPQGMADAGVSNSIKGLGRSVGSIFDNDAAINKSNFVKERYGGGAFSQFDRSFVDNTKKMAVWITSVLDEVGTKYIWNAEYEKALQSNIKNPIKFADDATRRMVAGRGVGEAPLIQKSKVFQLVAPFQLEVGNLWHVMGDWVNEKQFGKLVAFFAISHVFNKAAAQVRGSDVSLDPIQASIEAYQAFQEEGSPIVGGLRAGGRLAGEALSNIPLGQTVAGIYPEYGFKINQAQMPTRKDLFGEGDPTRFGSGLLSVKGLQDPLFKVAPPFGGQQIKRTLEGLLATDKGYSETQSGRIRFPTEDNPLRNVQRAVFGQYSTPAAREYFDRNTTPLGEKQSETFKNLSPEQGQQFYQNVMQKRGADDEESKGFLGGLLAHGDSVSAADGLVTYANDNDRRIAYERALKTVKDYADASSKLRLDDEVIDLPELQSELVAAKNIIRDIRKESPDFVYQHELEANRTGNVEDRSKWVVSTLSGLTGDARAEKIQELWDEGVITTGSKGVAERIKKDYGLDVYTQDKRPKGKKPKALNFSELVKATSTIPKSTGVFSAPKVFSSSNPGLPVMRAKLPEFKYKGKEFSLKS